MKAPEGFGILAGGLTMTQSQQSTGFLYFYGIALTTRGTRREAAILGANKPSLVRVAKWFAKRYLNANHGVTFLGLIDRSGLLRLKAWNISSESIDVLPFGGVWVYAAKVHYEEVSRSTRALIQPRTQ